MNPPEPKELIVSHPINLFLRMVREESLQENHFQSDYVFGARTYPEFIEQIVTLGLGYMNDYIAPANPDQLDLKIHLAELEMRNPSWSNLQFHLRMSRKMVDKDNAGPVTEEEFRDFSKAYGRSEIYSLNLLRKDNPERIFLDADELAECLNEYVISSERERGEADLLLI
jgi:hypothetical protein